MINKKDMKYLTLDYIKAHSRIDYGCEDDIIEQKGCAAEDAILKLLNRSLDDLKDCNGGKVPSAVMEATFELADSLIQHRSPTEQVSLSVVPYGFDLMLKPYILL